MNESILTSVKNGVGGIVEMDESFDDDIILHINTTLAELIQLGVGPKEGFEINDKSATWEDFAGNDKCLNMIKSYTILNVRMLFDPPSSGTAAKSFEQQIDKLGWRIREQAGFELPKDDWGENQNG
jgi:hypothetical protein